MKFGVPTVDAKKERELSLNQKMALKGFGGVFVVKGRFLGQDIGGLKVPKGLWPKSGLKCIITLATSLEGYDQNQLGVTA